MYKQIGSKMLIPSDKTGASGKRVNAWGATVCVCCIYTCAYLQQHTWTFPTPTDDIIFDFGGKSINWLGTTREAIFHCGRPPRLWVRERERRAEFRRIRPASAFIERTPRLSLSLSFRLKANAHTRAPKRREKSRNTCGKLIYLIASQHVARAWN
jgi:hypothetical protein